MHLFRGGQHRSLMNLPPSSSSPPALISVCCFSEGWRWSNGIRSFSTRQCKNLYKVLGVSSTASQTDIKKAYYTLSKKYHPDVTGSNKSCAQKYLEIKDAYEVLRDEKQRDEHDRWLAAEEAYRQRPIIERQNPFERKQKVYNEWWPNSGGTTYSEDELRRIWRTMSGNGEFRKASWEFEAAVRQKRQTAYEEQLKRRSEWTMNEFTNKSNLNDDKDCLRDWTEQNQYKMLGRIFLVYLFIAVFLELIRHFQGPMLPPPYDIRDEQARKWIEERTRRMP